MRIATCLTLAAAMFGLAACADQNPAEPSAAAAPAAATSVPGGIAADCPRLSQALGELEAQAPVLLAQLAAAKKDPGKAAAAVAALIRELKAFRDAYGAGAEAIADPGLKAAVQSDLAAIDSTLADIVQAGDDAARVELELQTAEFRHAGNLVPALCAMVGASPSAG
ncbi:hypothetical protein AB0B31_18390 [Catellatospora citrea]|uniref:hypothetical protein n=1 Tax=Catellatospora citrea TaxID=53366 RepID=UPI0033DDCDE1